MMTPAQLQELRRRITDAFTPEYVAVEWNIALKWIESQIIEVLGDPAFTNGDGPVTREEFEKVVRG
jgi:hypothetical protein